MFAAVLWDLDGTLLDSLALILDSYRHTLAVHDLPPRSDQDVLSGLGTTLDAQFIRWGYAARRRELVATFVDYNLREHDRLVRPFAGVQAIVRELWARGVPQALVTSKRRLGGEKGLRALDLCGLFAVEIYGDEVTRPKPDPDPVVRALAGLGLPASTKVTFVGDAIHDIEAGQAAGVHTIAVTWGAGRLAELQGADARVDDATALRALLLGA